MSDEELMQQLQDGKEDALAELMRRYEPKLTRYGRRFLAGLGSDLLRQAVQDVFISVYQNSAAFDRSQRFSPWVYRIAHNVFVDVLRQRTRQPVYGIDFDSLISHPVHEDTHRREKENEELRVVLEKSLDKVPAAYREILVLYYFEELSYKEIADVLHVPVSTVGVRLARARNRLKEFLPDSSHFNI